MKHDWLCSYFIIERLFFYISGFLLRNHLAVMNARQATNQFWPVFSVLLWTAWWRWTIA